MEIRNQRLSDTEFFREREEVLAMWPTGKGVDLEEAAGFHKSLPASKNFSLKLLEGKKKGITQEFLSSGADTVEAHSALIRYLEEHAQIDFASSYIDSFTRNNRFELAEKGVTEAIKTGRKVLNGFPFVFYGVSGTRKLIQSVGVPVMMMGPAPDLRLVYEIGFAGGHTGYSGGPLISFWNYTKSVRLETILRNFQYAHRLNGHYEERGVPIIYGPSGSMPCVTPCGLITASKIIECLIAAEQGCKHILLQNWAQGNLAQDVATIVTCSKLAQEYLRKFGYNDVATMTFSVSPTGRFPVDTAQSFALISHFALVGILGKVDLLDLRTVDEARHIPTEEGMTASHRCARMTVNLIKDQKIDFINSEAVRIEAAMEELEARAILDKVLEMGDGDVVVGTLRAIEAGVLDQPYATSQHVKCAVIGVKDAQGAARYLDHGQLPLPKEVLDFHQEKIAEREAAMGRRVSYDTVVKDMTAISAGSLLPPQ